MKVAYRDIDLLSSERALDQVLAGGHYHLPEIIALVMLKLSGSAPHAAVQVLEASKDIFLLEANEKGTTKILLVPDGPIHSRELCINGDKRCFVMPNL